jgi:hypothetical protein
LVNRNATKSFAFGLVEVALYQFRKTRFAIQPRVLAQTEIVTRHMTIVNIKGGMDSAVIEDVDADTEMSASNGEKGRSKDHLRAWWQPVLKMKFDDPEQEAPYWVGSNNAVLNTPFPGIQIKALAIVNSSQIGVFLSGSRAANVMMIQKYLKQDRRSLLEELPKGTEIRIGDSWPIVTMKFEIESDNEKRAWIMKTMNTFANVLRPRLRKWYQDS